jgi:hypothetical protein
MSRRTGLAALLEDAHDVGGEASVGLASEVGDVHGQASARFELVLALSEDVAEESEILQVGAGDALSVEFFLVLLAREVRG